MEKDWREVELVVAAMEALLGGTGLRVKSPDRLPDKDSGELREVDVSIRGTLGSHEVLIIIECRDRIAVQDVTWIEQLATKRASVGADKAIAVSTSGFSAGAVAKAAAHQVELRGLHEIQGITQADLVAPFRMFFSMFRLDIVGVRAEYCDADDERDFDSPKALPKPKEGATAQQIEFTRGAKAFIAKRSGDRYALNDILGWPGVVNLIFNSGPSDEPVELEIFFGKATDGLLVDFQGTSLRVLRLVIRARIRVDRTLHAPESMVVYYDNLREIARELRYTVSDGKEPAKFSLFVRPHVSAS